MFIIIMIGIFVFAFLMVYCICKVGKEETESMVSTVERKEENNE